MDLVGTVAEQTQRLLDRGFLLSAFLPLAATVLAVWVVLAGLPAVLSTLGRLAEQPAGETAVTAGLVLVGLYLAAFVAHGLRRTLRDAWSGAVPVAALREGLVARQFRRVTRLERRAASLGYELNAAYWLRRHALDPSAAKGAEHIPEDDRAISAAVRRCDRRLELLRTPGLPGATEMARHLLLELHALAGVDPLPGHARDAIGRLKQRCRGESPDDRRVADRLTAAALRIEQRFQALEDHLATSYPPIEALQATRLGNVLARTEHYSTRRYKIPLATLWPRLRIVAPDDDLSQVEDALVRVDFALATTTGGLLVTLTALVLIVVDGPSSERVAVGLAAAVVSVGLYRFAIVAARLYGAQIAATVDLNLAELEERLAQSLERKVDRDALYHFLARGDAVTSSGEDGAVAVAPSDDDPPPG